MLISCFVYISVNYCSICTKNSTNKTDRHDIAELLLEVALNIIIQPPALNDL